MHPSSNAVTHRRLKRRVFEAMKAWTIVKKVLKWLGVALLVAIVAGAIYVLVIWRQPLGPQLSFPTRTMTQIQAGQLSETPQLTESIETQEPSATIALPTHTATPEPVCGGPPSMLILAIGTDYRWNSYYRGLADVIRIVKVDFINQEVSALDIPRSLQVNIPDTIPSRYGCENSTSGLLNQSYLYGTEGMNCSDVSGYGAGLLARTLDANFGVQVENYVVVNMTTLSSAIDAVGGVPIYIYETIDDRQAPYLPMAPQHGYFSAGAHWLSGLEAVRYARIRSINGIFGRHERQNEILVQLRDRIMDPSVITAIPELVESFYGRVMTDLSLEQVSQLTCLGLGLTMDDVHFVSIPQETFVEGFNYQGYMALFADANAVSEYIDDFINGRPLSLTE